MPDRSRAPAFDPAQVVLFGFVMLILTGTALLSMPIAVDDGLARLGFRDALFWATSASTVTGLGTIDVSAFSVFGELVLLGLIQIGGFGIMTIGSVLAVVATERIGLRQRLLAQTEIGAVNAGELKGLVVAIAMITITVEATIGAILALHLATVDGVGLGHAVYSGVFHGVSAFNNAGISLYSDSLTRFASDPFVVFPITAAFVIGGLGFPVIVQIYHHAARGRVRADLRHRHWSLHAKITIAATIVLLVVGPAVVLVAEWTNPMTLGPMDVWDKIQAAWFQGVTPRTAGFNTIDIGAQREPTLNVMTVLMFVGAGPASTSGGIKVTTFAVLVLTMWSEIRGRSDVEVFHRRLPDRAVRQALTVTTLGVGTVVGTAVALTATTPFHLTDTLFEAASAFGTVGLSTGITADLPPIGHYLLVLVMLAGRVGPVTFVAALAVRARPHSHRYPEETPVIG